MDKCNILYSGIGDRCTRTRSHMGPCRHDSPGVPKNHVKAVQSILITKDEVLIDDGRGTVEHLHPSSIKVLMQDGKVDNLSSLCREPSPVGAEISTLIK